MAGLINMKKCNMCALEKPLDEFQLKDKTKGFSLRGNCRPCRALEMRNWRKTGTTSKNSLESKSMAHLERTLTALKLAYAKHGIIITKRQNITGSKHDS
jgi:hypothetical protein